MKKFILNFIIFIFITNCGYTPLYSVKNNINFKIGKVNITGDRDLNQNITYQLKNLKSKKTNNAKTYNLTIQTGIEKIVTSKETAHLSRIRGYNINEYMDNAESFQLIDSGHILGSRGLLIDNQIFYTGDIAGRTRGFIGPGKAVKCNTLIIESTFGKEEYVFPNTADIIRQTNELISELFSKGIPIVLLGYPLGKAQLITYFTSSWDPIYVHESVQRMNEAYNDLGVNIRNDHKEFSYASQKGLLDKKPWILISPNRVGKTNFANMVKKKYGAVTISFSGWGINPGYKYKRGIDHAFPLSDHCDFNELVSLVKKCDPNQIYTIHGFATEFASFLKGEGYNAEPLTKAQVKGQKSMRDYMK